MSGDYHIFIKWEPPWLRRIREKSRKRKGAKKEGSIFVILKVFPRNIVEVASSKFQALWTAVIVYIF